MLTMTYDFSNAKVPEYTIMREPVQGDIPEFLVMEVKLPGIVSL